MRLARAGGSLGRKSGRGSPQVEQLSWESGGGRWVGEEALSAQKLVPKLI